MSPSNHVSWDTAQKDLQKKTPPKQPQNIHQKYRAIIPMWDLIALHQNILLGNVSDRHKMS